MSVKHSATRFETYLEWTNSPRPSNRGEDRDAYSCATRLEHQKRQQGQNLGTNQVPLAAQMAWVLEEQVGYQKCFGIWIGWSSRWQCKTSRTEEDSKGHTLG